MKSVLKENSLDSSNDKKMNTASDSFYNKFRSMVDAQFFIHCKLMDGFIFRARFEVQHKPKTENQ